MSKFDIIIKRAKKRTPEQTKKRLIQIGILTVDGQLTPHYKQKDKRKKLK